MIETRTAWYTYRVLGDGVTGNPGRPGVAGVVGMQIVGPGDVGVILPVPSHPGLEATGRFITLTTCHPKFSARQRLVIHGLQAGPPWPKSRGLPLALQKG